MKECIACAEEIKENAKLCKHCGIKQDDPRYLTSDVDQDSSEFSLAALFEQVSKLRRDAKRANESATAENVDETLGTLAAMEIVFEFLSHLNPEEMGPGSDSYWQELRDFFNDQMGDTEYFDEDLHDEAELEYESAKWYALEKIYVAIVSEELVGLEDA